MTVKEIKAIIPAAVAAFKKRIPQSVDILERTQIKVATAKNKESLFYATIEELEAPHKKYMPNTVGEAIRGKNGYAVILFQFAIQSEYECFRVIWHELGHILSSVGCEELLSEAEVMINLGVPSNFTYGASAWAEFIAEAISNYVDNSYQHYEWAEFERQKLSSLLTDSFRNGSISLYHLGLFLAEFLTNPSAQIPIEDGVEIGLSQFPDSMAQEIVDSGEHFYFQLENNHYFDNMQVWGDKELNIGDFWKISREQLEDAGLLFYNLTDYFV